MITTANDNTTASPETIVADVNEFAAKFRQCSYRFTCVARQERPRVADSFQREHRTNRRTCERLIENAQRLETSRAEEVAEILLDLFTDVCVGLQTISRNEKDFPTASRFIPLAIEQANAIKKALSVMYHDATGEWWIQKDIWGRHGNHLPQIEGIEVGSAYRLD